jgi:hypothetical protein
MEVISQLHAPAPLPPGTKAMVRIGQEAGVNTRAGLDVVVRRKKKCIKNSCQKSRREEHSEDPGSDGRTIPAGMCGSDTSGRGQRAVEGSLVHGNGSYFACL